MKSTDQAYGSLTARFFALLLFLACVALGIVGLILPLIPGLLFLGLAAVIAAMYSSTIERLLRSNRTMNGLLDKSRRFLRLTFWRKLQFMALLSAKTVVDTADFLISLAKRKRYSSTRK